MSAPKLYYTPTSCGAASFIVGHAAGVNFESEQVDLKTHKTASGADFYQINPKGNVPTLVLPGGEILNEGPAVCQYLADQAPGKGLLGAVGSPERYVTIGDFNWVGTELHKTVGPLFSKPEGAVLEYFTSNTHKKLEFLNKELDGKKYMHGDKFTIADSYLYIVLSWLPYLGVSLEKYPNVQKFFDGIHALPIVQESFAKMNAK
eukprot:TRINITY_DN537_c0_g1_i2.p2 TRINITY_DN537_c0_g1~~TRINITY_DN537_c0_g1_i2.p2  ORF type:complete len:204 (+),score=86.35 TRINITY_DN537_c0_g1_i2:67-678(+)